MTNGKANPLSEEIGKAAAPLLGESRDFDKFLDIVGEARFVLLGEATHGTHEFYRTRAEITQRLIEEKGFTAVAVEADWPDAYRVNRYVQGIDEGEAAAALAGFERFPQWMWRNHDVLALVGWLRSHNAALPAGAPRAGFYGLDLYSLYGSIEAVLNYLETVDPEAARQARYRYSCFEHFGEDPQRYGLAASYDLAERCEEEAVRQLVELRRRAADYLRFDGRLAEDEFFFAEQNARLIKNAEAYYRAMYRGRVSSWNWISGMPRWRGCCQGPAWSGSPRRRPRKNPRRRSRRVSIRCVRNGPDRPDAENIVRNEPDRFATLGPVEGDHPDDSVKGRLG